MWSHDLGLLVMWSRDLGLLVMWSRDLGLLVMWSHDLGLLVSGARLLLGAQHNWYCHLNMTSLLPHH